MCRSVYGRPCCGRTSVIGSLNFRTADRDSAKLLKAICAGAEKEYTAMVLTGSGDCGGGVRLSCRPFRKANARW